MSARVLIHPRCVNDMAAARVLSDTLAGLGYDMDTFAVYDPPSVRRSNVHELVRDKGRTSANDGQRYERMDGTQFVHPDPAPVTPERA